MDFEVLRLTVFRAQVVIAFILEGTLYVSFTTLFNYKLEFCYDVAKNTDM